MIVNYEDTMREISFILEKCKCNVDDDKAIFAVEDKDFAKLCDLMVSMQGTVDVPFKCTAGDKKYTVNEWEITFVETSKELYTKRDVYLIHIIGKFYQNIYEDGVDYPIFQFEDGELAILDSQDTQSKSLLTIQFMCGCIVQSIVRIATIVILSLIRIVRSQKRRARRLAEAMFLAMTLKKKRSVRIVKDIALRSILILLERVANTNLEVALVIESVATIS